jgi:hypothetical protein
MVDDFESPPRSKPLIVAGLTLAFSAKSLTVQLSPALAILHCLGVIVFFLRYIRKKH